MVISQTQ